LWVHFDDGKVVPLSSFDRRSYDLEIENETPTIIALVSEDYTNRFGQFYIHFSQCKM